MTSNPRTSRKLLDYETRFAALLVHYLFRESFSMRKYAGEKRLDDITQGRREGVRTCGKRGGQDFVMYGEKGAVLVLEVGLRRR